MCVMQKVGKDPPTKSYADHIGGILKKGQILSTRNRRARMKILTDVSEAREKRNMANSLEARLPIAHSGTERDERELS
ncbi:hypothetical protein EVAR_48749_1 [Eumeta japonica]|uniref:Uncharacterized protein n=1 Tax=Eumeta variegata TaxID=151549 RepID=A0A4C1YKB4_EUMVA|nr:hypothetical protein EVAR_48749_1 [Eumeta japonica]